MSKLNELVDILDRYKEEEGILVTEIIVDWRAFRTCGSGTTRAFLNKIELKLESIKNAPGPEPTITGQTKNPTDGYVQGS